MTTSGRQAADHRRDGERESNLAKIIATRAAKYLTATQLSECRSDVNWENGCGMRHNVVCRDCGFIGGQSLFNHLTAVHKWDRKAYRHRYPKAPMRSIAYLENLPLKLGTVLPFPQVSLGAGSKSSIGRPRKDNVRDRVMELKNQGKSWKQVQILMNQETGNELTLNAYRNLVSRTAKKSIAKKTHVI